MAAVWQTNGQNKEKFKNQRVNYRLCDLSNCLAFFQKHLAELGLTEAVDKTKADLSNISGKKDLYLSNVFHASNLELDVEGNPIDTSIFGTEKLRNPKLFYLDHPFIFLVKDNKTNSIMYIGRVVRPNGDKMRDEL